MNLAIALVIATAFLNTAAQLLLKAAVNKIGDAAFNLGNLLPLSWQLASNPYLIFGLCIYAFSVLVWLFVLSRIDVSAAYPLMSVGFIINAVAAHYLLNEPLTFTRISGIIVIMAGVYLVSRTV